jgi:hypothetical protein
MRIVDASETKENRGRPSQYPWDEWLVPHKTCRLYQGEDFEVEPTSLRPQAHNKARQRGGSASTSLGTEGGRKYLDVTYKPGLKPEDVVGDFDFEKTG